MRLAPRPVAALVVFALVAGLVAAGRWYEAQRAAPEALASSSTVAVSVTNGADRGPGTLREALFVVATAQSAARITLEVPRIVLETPLPPIVNSHGISIVAHPGGGEIDARALSGGPVLDIAAANTSLSGLTLQSCPGAGILVRAARFRLESSTLEGCDVGVDVAENAANLLITRNRFANDRVGVRFAASSRDTAVVANDFSGDKDAGIWAVRSEPDPHGDAISVRDNRFDRDHAGIVAGNVAILIEHNEVTGAQDAAVHLVGSASVVRGNRVSGGPGMGIVAEGANGAVIENNELDGLAAYGILVRGSRSTLLRANRLYNCAYGMGFVLGDARNPSTAVDNMIIEPHYDGIDVVGDSPILRRNQVLRPHAFALRVENFQSPAGAAVTAAPFLEGNSFGPASAVAWSGNRARRQ
jgi:parallel beta-helix repeat protein